MKRWLFFILFIGWMVYIAAFPPSMLQNEPIKTQPVEFLKEAKSILIQNTPSIRDLSNITEEEINRRTISFEPLQNCAYYAPFFIFQATYGEIASDYYLFSLNTQTGELVKIHKGFHGDFWIKANRFIFRHTDHVFQCTIPNWSQLTEIKMQTWDDMIASREGKLNENKTPIRQSYSCELPTALQLLDWEYIYCVMEGSFTKPKQKEILFISGRKPTYDIAVYRWQNSEMLVSENLGKLSTDSDWATLSEHCENSMLNFRQAIFEDFDRDGCLEILINGVYATHAYIADPLLFLDFSLPKSKKKFTLIKQTLSDAEILRTKNGLLYVGDSRFRIDGLKAFLILFSTKNQTIELKEITALREEMKQFLANTYHGMVISPKQFGITRKHLSFARTGRNLSDAGTPIKLASKQYPKLSICPLYQEKNPALTPKEKSYHTKRNELLRRYIKQLDSGWFPFSDLDINDEDAPSFLKDKKLARESMNAIVELIPIFIEKEVLPAILIKFLEGSIVSEGPYINQTILFLYDNQYQLLDYYKLDTGYPPDEDHYELYLPLPQETSIFFQSSIMKGSLFFSLKISNHAIQETQNLYVIDTDFFTYQNQFILHVLIFNNYLGTNWGDAGNGVGFYHDYFMDPFTKEIKDLEFTNFFKKRLDYLYYKFHFFNYRVETTAVQEKAMGVLTDILERYEKNIYYHELAPRVEDDDGER